MQPSIRPAIQNSKTIHIQTDKITDEITEQSVPHLSKKR